MLHQELPTAPEGLNFLRTFSITINFRIHKYEGGPRGNANPSVISSIFNYLKKFDYFLINRIATQHDELSTTQVNKILLTEPCTVHIIIQIYLLV